jgi:hypothetical protein
VHTSLQITVLFDVDVVVSTRTGFTCERGEVKAAGTVTAEKQDRSKYTWDGVTNKAEQDEV